MLIRNENTIDIVKNGVKKGTSKKMFLYGLVSFFILFMLAMCFKFDFKIIETYIFIFCIWCFPSYLFILAGIIYLRTEDQNNKLIVSVSKDYVNFFTKKENKNILLKDIMRISKVSSIYGNFLIVYYTENEKEKKYQFDVSRSNLNLVCIAIKEYSENIMVN